MNKKTTKRIAAGVIGLTAFGAAGAVAPSIAAAQDTTTEEAATTVGPLQSLVDDATITQAQADAIGERFKERIGERGFGQRGFGARMHGQSEVLTSLLGVTGDEIGEALRSGQTLVDFADANGVSEAVLVDTLVAEANTRLDEAVAAGTISAEDADPRRADLTERITERVNGERPAFRGNGLRGPRG